MDALMAALVLGAITQASDRTPWLAAILADRLGRVTVVVALVVALAINYVLAVVGGRLLAPMMTPQAKLLLLALALLLAGLGTGWRAKRPEALEHWRLPAPLTALLGLLIMAFGDRMQFVVAALAARSDLPWAAAVGATLGAGLVGAGVAMTGEAAWLRLPLRAIRIVAAAILAVAGILLGLAALHLI
jgi:putative Ca2+/H+ antiporter (TMEM165/GDT1 family)